MKGQRAARRPGTGARESIDAESQLATYGWVIDTRDVLFGFLEGLPFDLLCKDLPSFGHGSIRNLLAHVARTYRWWLHAFPRGQTLPRRDAKEIKSCMTFREDFRAVDRLVRSFLRAQGGGLDEPSGHVVPWDPKPFVTTPRWLFTHVVTHEFHHKGQIVTMCRQLGHPPIETDLALPKR